jgi:hypothetical protein
MSRPRSCLLEGTAAIAALVWIIVVLLTISLGIQDLAKGRFELIKYALVFILMTIALGVILSRRRS